MYTATGQGQITPGDKILMLTETSCHFGHLLQVSKKSLWSLILYIFFHDFIHVYYIKPRGRGWQILGTKFWCQQEHLVTSVGCRKFKKKSLWSLDFIQFLAHLSRRLTRWAYRMGLEPACVRACVRPCVHPHFQTWISPRPAGRLQPNFIWSIIGVGERLH